MFKTVFLSLCVAYSSLVLADQSSINFDFTRIQAVLHVVDDGVYVYAGLPVERFNELGPEHNFVVMYRILNKYKDRFVSEGMALEHSQAKLVLVADKAKVDMHVGQNGFYLGEFMAPVEAADIQKVMSILNWRDDQKKLVPLGNMQGIIDSYYVDVTGDSSPPVQDPEAAVEKPKAKPEIRQTEEIKSAVEDAVKQVKKQHKDEVLKKAKNQFSFKIQHWLMLFIFTLVVALLISQSYIKTQREKARKAKKKVAVRRSDTSPL